MAVRRNFTRTFALRPLKHRVQQAALAAGGAEEVSPPGTPKKRSPADPTRKRPAASPGSLGTLRRRLREKSMAIILEDSPPTSGIVKREQQQQTSNQSSPSKRMKSQTPVEKVGSPQSSKGSPQVRQTTCVSGSGSSSSSGPTSRALPSSSTSTPPPKIRHSVREASSQFSTPKRAQSSRVLGSQGPGRASRGPRKSFHPVQKALEEEGLGVILLEDEPSPILTREGILTKEHLLLPFETSQRALDLCNTMLKMVAVWRSDQTDLYTDLWEVYLQPTAVRAVRAARARKFKEAMADLLGILLFTTRQDMWIRQQEAYENWPAFQRFFEHSTEAWAAVLVQSDDALGLAPKSGKAGGYRMQLCSLLRCWQDITNRVLREEAWCKGRLTVRVLPEPVKVESG